MPTTVQLYPFDPTGEQSSNLITGEQQTLTSYEGKDYQFLVPTLAPYFAESLVVKFRDTNNNIVTWQEGVDYYCTHWFISASRACAKPIYGSITPTNTQISGTVILSYQTIGGDWNIDSAQIATILADTMHNPRITSWEEVANCPYAFPPIDHEWDLVDLVGMTELIAKLGDIETALRSTGDTGLQSHIQNLNNPHQVTAAQVGLGNVPNYSVADTDTAQAGTSDMAFMTPAKTVALMGTIPGGQLTQHIAEENPHNTTASDVGAYSKSETDTLLTQKLSTNAVAADSNKFGGKTTTDYRDYVLAGTSANATKFAGYTFNDYTNYVIQQIIPSGISDIYSKEEVDQKLNGKLDSNGSVDNANHFGGQTPADFTASVLSGTAANADHFGGMTPADYATQVLTGKSADSDKLGGQTFAQIQGTFDNRYSLPGTVTPQQRESAYRSASGTQANVWTQLGVVTVPAISATYSGSEDAQWWVTNGEAESDQDAGLYLVRTAVRGPSGSHVNLHAISMNDIINADVQFGYVFVDSGDGDGSGEMQVWIKTKDDRANINVTDLTRGNAAISTLATIVNSDTEPTGIVYTTSDLMLTKSRADTLYAPHP